MKIGRVYKSKKDDNSFIYWPVKNPNDCVGNTNDCVGFVNLILIRPFDLGHKIDILLLPVTCQIINGSVSRQNFLFLFIYFFIFLTGEKKVNPEHKCPSMNQLKREKKY